MAIFVKIWKQQVVHEAIPCAIRQKCLFLNLPHFRIFETVKVMYLDCIHNIKNNRYKTHNSNKAEKIREARSLGQWRRSVGKSLLKSGQFYDVGVQRAYGRTAFQNSKCVHVPREVWRLASMQISCLYDFSIKSYRGWLTRSRLEMEGSWYRIFAVMNVWACRYRPYLSLVVCTLALVAVDTEESFLKPSTLFIALLCTFSIKLMCFFSSLSLSIHFQGWNLCVDWILVNCRLVPL